MTSTAESTTTVPVDPPTPSRTARDARARHESRPTAFLRRLLLGREDAARWERPALLALLAVAAVLYVWDLSASGWANSFYSAAVQAGTKNWEAFFYGSSDAGNSITVDKPPASLWIMELSARAFGLSPLSMLLPEAIMGVVTVALVYAIVRRHFSPAAALISGGALAITPVAALMFRFNNPDALLVLLTVLATYLTLRGIESGRIRWVIWAGVAVGFAFLTKQLQGFLVVPALGIAYLTAAKTTFGKRLLHLLAALAAIAVAAGWWVAIVQLVPASARPYIGGSQTNSFLELTFGYNGFGRITGSETGSVTGGGGGTAGAGMWGATGILRLFENEFGGQVSWLLPAALVLLVVSFVLIGRAPRTDGRRATLLLMGGTLVVTGLVFSFMGGIFHAYYTVALAPSLAAVTGIGSVLLWAKRERLWARILLAALVLLTAGWAFVLLQEAADWLPWLKWVVLIAAAVGAVLVGIRWSGRRMSALAAAVALTAVLLAPFAYTMQTVTTAHTGSIVTAGPTVASGTGGPGGGFGGATGAQGGFGQGAAGQGAGQNQGGFGAPTRNGQAPTMPGGTAQGGTAQGGTAQGSTGTTGRGGASFGRGGGAGGLLGSSNVGSALKALLQKNASEYSWVAAAIGSNSAAGYQLATGDAVMPIGGFNGSDPSPTLAQFEKLVAEGRIHYFIGGSVGQANGGSSASSEIASWVAKHFTAKTVGGATVYDLTS
jgi:4-amino-4-deoxy-L-arabinose transferase-like glycosyltransferase